MPDNHLLSMYSEDDHFVFQPTIARMLGIREAILLQLMYALQEEGVTEKDGRLWIAVDHEQWYQEYPWLMASADHIKDTLERLVDLSIVIAGNETWHSVDAEAVNKMVDLWKQHGKPPYFNEDDDGDEYGWSNPEHLAFIDAWKKAAQS